MDNLSVLLPLTISFPRDILKEIKTRNCKIIIKTVLIILKHLISYYTVCLKF